MTQHARLPYIHDYITEEQKKFNTLTVVRNPWRRMVSAFYYLYHAHVKKFETFDNWLTHKHTMVTKKQYREGSHYIPQVEYTHIDNERVAQYILRTEHLQQDWDHFCFQTGLTPAKELPKTNVSALRKKGYLEHYNNTTKDMVHEMYQSDIEQFKYKYE